MTLRSYEPCPRCGRLHVPSEYKPQPQRFDPKINEGVPIAPDDVQCPCGATLRHSVPFFKVNASGWVWRIL